MHINVTFRHMDATEPLKQYAVEKVSKIKKYVDAPIEVQVVLSVEKFRHIAEVSFNLSGFVVKGQEATEDMYAAIDMVTDKIERQVRRYRDRLKGRRSAVPGEERLEVTENVFSYPAEEQEGEAQVIRSTNFSIKPMAIDEAVMQMNLMDNDFLVFRNDTSNEVNVIYRRKDGNYGLIEPNA
ncbi:MAG: ribosome-associated translation inhibitor RaiA [Deltaproteobacteria bacterium]|nr:ribosome-associated translation inhibitor RaiA [Candidatus Anaeroferrophillacea bacterium]